MGGHDAAEYPLRAPARAGLNGDRMLRNLMGACRRISMREGGYAFNLAVRPPQLGGPSASHGVLAISAMANGGLRPSRMAATPYSFHSVPAAIQNPTRYDKF